MIEWNLKRTVAPPENPVTTAEVKSQARIDTTAEDSLIDRLISAATASIEGPYGIGIALVEQTWELKLDWFPLEIQLPLYPVLSVESIKYIDTEGTEQTLDSSVYRVDTHSNPARITLEWNETWPSTRLISNAVTVTFKAGYAVEGSDYQANVPQDLRHAITLLVAHWYENREAVSTNATPNRMPMAADAILERYRVPGVF